MKCVKMAGPRTSVVEEVPDVHAGENELQIHLTYMGICMSEHDKWATAQPGVILGHEPVGVVTEVGERVTGFQVGDRVSGLWAQGMYEYNVVDPSKDLVVKLPDSLPDTQAILEPLACILSAASKARIQVPGDPVLVIGCGYMGCGAISALKLRGAYVIAVDLKPEALENAKRFGADVCCTPDEALAWYGPTVDARGETHFNGVPTVMEWGENEKSLDTAIRLTARCGQLCIGAYHTGGKRLVDVQQLNVKAVDCLSVHPREEDLLEKCARNSVRLLASGAWNFSKIPTMVYPMGQLDRAYQDLENKPATFMKAVLSMREVTGEPVLC